MQGIFKSRSLFSVVRNTTFGSYSLVPHYQMLATEVF